MLKHKIQWKKKESSKQHSETRFCYNWRILYLLVCKVNACMYTINAWLLKENTIKNMLTLPNTDNLHDLFSSDVKAFVGVFLLVKSVNRNKDIWEIPDHIYIRMVYYKSCKMGSQSAKIHCNNIEGIKRLQ